MTPKEKAIELLEKFYMNVGGLENKKQCSLICVDEIINAHIKISKEESGTTLIDYGQGFWQEVKEEIEKL